VELSAPDRALREKLFGRFLADANVPTTPELLAYLAERSAASVRELIGTVHRVCAAADSLEEPLTLPLARQVLESGGGPATAAPTSVRQAADVYFLDDEKLVWEWPDVTSRLVEEMR
jgi:chromosomal replication initiation ATPase DnaA